MNSLPSDKEKYISKIVLNLITKYPDFKSQLQASFPDLYADIESASSNPNCSCRGKVEHRVTLEREKSIKLVNEFLSKHGKEAEVQTIINLPYNSMTSTFYGGKRYEIDNTTEAFKEFSNQLLKDRATFRGFSVYPQNDKLLIYFL
jgi:hypothetical protein